MNKKTRRRVREFDHAALARLGHVICARITQIMNLLHLAPDIQKEILFLPETDGGRASVHERAVRPICAEINWRRQREMWLAFNRFC